MAFSKNPPVLVRRIFCMEVGMPEPCHTPIHIHDSPTFAALPRHRGHGVLKDTWTDLQRRSYIGQQQIDTQKFWPPSWVLPTHTVGRHRDPIPVRRQALSFPLQHFKHAVTVGWPRAHHCHGALVKNVLHAFHSCWKLRNSRGKKNRCSVVKH